MRASIKTSRKRLKWHTLKTAPSNKWVSKGLWAHLFSSSYKMKKIDLSRFFFIDHTWWITLCKRLNVKIKVNWILKSQIYTWVSKTFSILTPYWWRRASAIKRQSWVTFKMFGLVIMLDMPSLKPTGPSEHMSKRNVMFLTAIPIQQIVPNLPTRMPSMLTPMSLSLDNWDT